MIEVPCPCCHGEGVLTVYDHGFDRIEKCCHCDGKGKIKTELAEITDDD